MNFVRFCVCVRVCIVAQLVGSGKDYCRCCGHRLQMVVRIDAFSMVNNSGRCDCGKRQ